jgi:hypothetical protein
VAKKKSGPTAQRSYGVDVVSDVLLFGRVWYGETNAASNAIDYAKFFGGLDYVAVAQRIRRTESTYNPIAARRLITTMLNV